MNIVHPTGEVFEREVAACLDMMSPWLWRIEVAKSRIELLYRPRPESQDTDLLQLLKNRESRQRLVHPEDLATLESVMLGLRMGTSGTAVFRVLDAGGTTWFRLSGCLSEDDPRFVLGYLIDISDVVEAVCRKMGSAMPPQLSQTERSLPFLPTEKLLTAMAEADRIETVLQALFEHQGASRIDAVMFSDIHARKNRVYVYSHGQPFVNLPQGKVFPYEGTIAENIVNFGLDHLIVDDTLDSIKPIDWALFIPAGIRSYLAKPFYRGQSLRSVLIFCSMIPQRFSETGIQEFEFMYGPFLSGLKQWRKSMRNSRKAAGAP